MVGLSDIVFDPVVSTVVSGFGNINRRLQSFDLAEKQLVITLRIRPILQQPTRCSCDADVATLTPCPDTRPDSVDEGIFLDAVLGPLRVEYQLLVFGCLPRLGDWNKIGTDSPFLFYLIGDPFVGEPPMPLRFLER